MPDLYLMRHAKSAYPPGVPDHERPLNDRGQRDAHAVGEWWREHHPSMDLVLVSDAVRTQQTWAAMADAITAGQVRTVPELYDAHPLAVLRLLGSLQCASALVIAHNPAMQELVLRAAATDPSDYLGSIAMKFPTAAIATIRLSAWNAIEDGQGVLIDYAVPRSA